MREACRPDSHEVHSQSASRRCRNTGRWRGSPGMAAAGAASPDPGRSAPSSTSAAAAALMNTSSGMTSKAGSSKHLRRFCAFFFSRNWPDQPKIADAGPAIFYPNQPPVQSDLFECQVSSKVSLAVSTMGRSMGMAGIVDWVADLATKGGQGRWKLRGRQRNPLTRCAVCG